MFKKLFMLTFVLALVSACASNRDGSNGEFDILDDSEQADAMNKKTAKDIEEVSVPDRIYFGFDKYNITNDSNEILKLQAQWLKSDPTISIMIEGHCDERGTREYNLALGERRAVAAKNYLVKQGVDAKRIKTISYGKERPVFVGTGEAVWAKNRVSVTVVSK